MKHWYNHCLAKKFYRYSASLTSLTLLGFLPDELNQSLASTHFTFMWKFCSFLKIRLCHLGGAWEMPKYPHPVESIKLLCSQNRSHGLRGESPMAGELYLHGLAIFLQFLLSWLCFLFLVLGQVWLGFWFAHSQQFSPLLAAMPGDLVLWSGHLGCSGRTEI